MVEETITFDQQNALIGLVGYESSDGINSLQFITFDAQCFPEEGVYVKTAAELAEEERQRVTDT